MDLYEELKRRNVLRVGAAYLVVGWLVLQFIDVVFPILGVDESLGRPLLIVLAIGLPVALALAWFFELTPEGLKQEKHVDRSTSVTVRTGRTLDRVIIVILVIAIGLLLVDKFVLQPPTTEPIESAADRTSIAVLPFVNVSGNAEDEYFSDGLTETLLHILAQVPQIKVAARTSVFSFKDRDVDIREIADSLGVATVLEGSVQRAGARVRITAQLIAADSGFHLWSSNFDRNLDDIFAVQDEIATSVAAALESTLLSGAEITSLATRDASAYETYLLGLEQKNMASYSSLPRAEGLFKEALSLDPGFCEATVELAYTYQMQAETGLLTQSEADSRILPLLDQALELRPNDGRALGLLAAIDWGRALLAFGPRSDGVADAKAALEHAVALAPNEPILYAVLGLVAVTSGDNEEALHWVDKGLDVDPLSARLHLQRGRLLLDELDRPDEADEAFAKGRELAPDWTALVFSSGDVALTQGRYADGISWYQQAMTLDPQDHELPALISEILYHLGLPEQAAPFYERARAMAPQEPATRRLQLLRHLREDNFERAVIVAEAIIRDDLEDRGGAYSIAVSGYVSSMIELGRADKVGEFFESIKPGIGTVGYQPQSFKESILQFMLVLALVHIGSIDTANQLLEPLLTLADQSIPDWRENNRLMMWTAIAQGDREAAIDF
ncbi:MAG: tetratricopeptide repeat protein, partial [Woeseiaceae bacterium]